VISRIEADNWLTKTSKKDEEEMKKKLMESSGVNWINGISYTEIVEKFLPEADIFVLPTWGDNWGHVLCEAMSAGLPVISTKIRAIPEIIQHNTNGFLIDLPVDKHGVLYTNKLNTKDPDYFKTAREEYKGIMKKELKNYLIKLLQDKDTLFKFGQKARKLFKEKFTYEARNKKLIKIYENILKE
jgi:glycosyltransferase involved in cell wall biosynthesis